MVERAKAAMDALTAEAHGLRTIVKAFMVIIVPLVLAASTFSCVALDASNEAQDAVDTLDEQGVERRVASCLAFNDDQAKLRQLAEVSADAWETFAAILIGDRPIEGDLASTYSAFQAGVVTPLRDIAAGLEDRDCTPEGIDAYLSTTTITPATVAPAIPTEP